MDSAKIFANIRDFKRIASGLPLDDLDSLPAWQRVDTLAEVRARRREPLSVWQYMPSGDVGPSRSEVEAAACRRVERWAKANQHYKPVGRNPWHNESPIPLYQQYGRDELSEVWHSVKRDLERRGKLPKDDLGFKRWRRWVAEGVR